MKTVASISFMKNDNLAMDIEGVTHIERGSPVEMENGVWGVEILIRTDHGTVALNLEADALEKLTVIDYVG